MERRLDRVGCNITTFPAPESAAVADPIVIAQRAALLLEATVPFSRFNVLGNVHFIYRSCNPWFMGLGLLTSPVAQTIGKLVWPKSGLLSNCIKCSAIMCVCVCVFA